MLTMLSNALLFLLINVKKHAVKTSIIQKRKMLVIRGKSFNNNIVNFEETLTNDAINFEQPVPDTFMYDQPRLDIHRLNLK